MKLKNFVKLNKEEHTPKGSKKQILSKCGLCQENQECRNIFGPNFVGHDYITSPYICEDCAVLFSDTLRKKSFHITENTTGLIMQKDIADILRNTTFPCILSFTESNKKHRLYKSTISYDRTRVAVECDNERIYLNLDTDVPLMDFLENIYNNHKMSKSWLITGDIPAVIIKDMGIKLYTEYRGRTDPIRGQPKLRILVAFINANEEKQKKFNKPKKEKICIEKQNTKEQVIF